MSKIKLKQYSLDDWTGIYLNGELLLDGHSLSASDVLNKLSEIGFLKFDSEYIEAHDDLDEFGNSMPTDESEMIKYCEKWRLNREDYLNEKNQ